MLRLVTIDLTGADLDAFEQYENEVLRLAPKHGGRLEFRLRALDGASETHLLHFPDEAAFERYLSDPARLALADLRERSKARASAVTVEPYPPSGDPG